MLNKVQNICVSFDVTGSFYALICYEHAIAFFFYHPGAQEGVGYLVGARVYSCHEIDILGARLMIIIHASTDDTSKRIL